MRTGTSPAYPIVKIIRRVTIVLVAMALLMLIGAVITLATSGIQFG